MTLVDISRLGGGLAACFARSWPTRGVSHPYTLGFYTLWKRPRWPETAKVYLEMTQKGNFGAVAFSDCNASKLRFPYAGVLFRGKRRRAQGHFGFPCLAVCFCEGTFSACQHKNASCLRSKTLFDTHQLGCDRTGEPTPPPPPKENLYR